MRRYRKKPVEVTAVQWTGDNMDEMLAFTKGDFERDPTPGDPDDAGVYNRDEDGRGDTWAAVSPGDWLVKGADGLFIGVTADVFAEAYEPVHGPEITGHPAYAQWFATGERIRAELGATNANHASWIPHPFAGEGLPVCAACEQSERSQVHWHDCIESGCGTARAVDA